MFASMITQRTPTNTTSRRGSGPDLGELKKLDAKPDQNWSAGVVDEFTSWLMRPANHFYPGSSSGPIANESGLNVSNQVDQFKNRRLQSESSHVHENGPLLWSAELAIGGAGDSKTDQAVLGLKHTEKEMLPQLDSDSDSGGIPWGWGETFDDSDASPSAGSGSTNDVYNSTIPLTNATTTSDSSSTTSTETRNETSYERRLLGGGLLSSQVVHSISNSTPTPTPSSAGDDDNGEFFPLTPVSPDTFSFQFGNEVAANTEELTGFPEEKNTFWTSKWNPVNWFNFFF